MYAALSLAIAPGLDFGIKEEKILFIRIVGMYAVVAAVNLVSRFEQARRREAVEREHELQRERIGDVADHSRYHGPSPCT